MKYLEIECFFRIKMFIHDKSGIISYYYREEKSEQVHWTGKGGGEWVGAANTARRLLFLF